MYLTTEAWILAAAALALGLLLGWLVWGRALGKQQRAAFSVAQAQSALTEERSGRQGLERELAAARDQIKPLADEVDKLRRDLARAQRARPLEAAPPPPAAPTAAAPADLRQLKGVGDKLAARLADAGVRDIPALAALSPADAARLDSELGPFAGRLARDHLVEQARLLDDGRVTEYEARYGRLGG